MQGFKQKVNNFITAIQTSKRNFLTALFVLALLIGLPLSLIAAQTQQQLQQRASGKDVVALPTGTKLIFTIHVDNLVPQFPAVFYIALKNSTANQEKNDEEIRNHTYTTNDSGNITLQVSPNDRLIISPLASKGYQQIVPERMEISVLDGKCGTTTPCTFTAHPNDDIKPTVSPTLGIKPPCIQRPRCLDEELRCLIAEPVGGWCPMPTPSCIPRPGCLDSKPRCMIAEPAQGWCPPTLTPTVSPTISLTPTPSSTPKICPTLPTVCRYTGNGYCKVSDDKPNSCSCGEIVCTGL